MKQQFAISQSASGGNFNAANGRKCTPTTLITSQITRIQRKLMDHNYHNHKFEHLSSILDKYRGQLCDVSTHTRVPYHSFAYKAPIIRILAKYTNMWTQLQLMPSQCNTKHSTKY